MYNFNIFKTQTCPKHFAVHTAYILFNRRRIKYNIRVDRYASRLIIWRVHQLNISNSYTIIIKHDENLVT